VNSLNSHSIFCPYSFQQLRKVIQGRVRVVPLLACLQHHPPGKRVLTFTQKESELRNQTVCWYPDLEKRGKVDSEQLLATRE
jgi:hypothetical protein